MFGSKQSRCWKCRFDYAILRRIRRFNLSKFGYYFYLYFFTLILFDLMELLIFIKFKST